MAITKMRFRHPGREQGFGICVGHHRSRHWRHGGVLQAPVWPDVLLAEMQASAADVLGAHAGRLARGFVAEKAGRPYEVTMGVYS